MKFKDLITWTWALIISVSESRKPSNTFDSSINFFQPQSCSFFQKRCNVSDIFATECYHLKWRQPKRSYQKHLTDPNTWTSLDLYSLQLLWTGQNDSTLNSKREQNIKLRKIENWIKKNTRVKNISNLGEASRD